MRDFIRAFGLRPNTGIIHLTATVIAICIGICFGGCALQASPGGGEIDKTPPTVIATYPADGTMHYSENFIEFTFSEYVDKRKFKDALFISPAIEGELEFSWTNKTVEVAFPKKLLPNRTYTISVGTDLSDVNNGNRMAESYSLKFSTGDRIDNGLISGRVIDKSPSGVIVGAYLLDTAFINPSYRKPDYLSQAGDSGQFVLKGISPGKYRIFAIRDQFKDVLFQPDQDQIGIASRDILISEKDSLHKGLNITLQSIDTLKPRLLNAVMTDKNHILVGFSKPIRFELLKNNDFTLIDSSSKTRTSPAGIYKGRAKEKEYILATDALFSDSTKAVLIADNFSDASGNRTISDTVTLIVSSRPDTTLPSIINILPETGSKDIRLEGAVIQADFDEFVDLRNGAVVLLDTMKNVIPCNYEYPGSASVRLRPKSPLKSFTDYRISADMKKLNDLNGNIRDTVIYSNFKTINILDFSGIYGSVINLEKNTPNGLYIENTRDTSIKYYATLTESGKYSFDKIMPGKYRMLFFYDRNNNGILDQGKLTPFELSEPFIIKSDDLQVTARWSLTDVTFDVRECRP